MFNVQAKFSVYQGVITRKKQGHEGRMASKKKLMREKENKNADNMEGAVTVT